MVPEEIRNRPKQPYQAPDIKAFVSNGKIHEVASDLLSDGAIRQLGVFSPDMVKRLLTKIAGRSEYGYRDNMVFTYVLTTQICALNCSNKATPFKRTDKPTISICVNPSEKMYELQT
jgi:hypothetical protein